MDRDEIIRVLRAFEEAGLEYVLIGVATPLALYRLKKGTVRAQDHVDAAGVTAAVQFGKMKSEKSVPKFRSIEEMNNAPVSGSRKPDFERFLRHCARYWAIAPKHYPRGVFKFRSIEEAQQAREKHSL